jgi:enterobacterial common antigen flippase
MKSRVRALGATFLTNLLIVGLGVLSGLIVARLLQPEGRGQLAAIMFWPQLIGALGFISLGDTIVVMRGGQLIDAPRLRGVVFSLCFVLVPIGLAVGWLVLPIVLGDLGSDLLLIAYLYLAAFLFVNYLSLTAIAFDQGSLRFSRFNWFRVIQPALYVVALAWLWITGNFRVDTVIWASLLGACVATLGLLIRPGEASPQMPRLDDLVKVISRALRIHGHSILATTTSYVDRALVLLVFGYHENGLYAVAWTVASTLMGLVSNTFTMVVLPFAARGQGTSNAIDQLLRTIRYSVLACALAMTGVSLVNLFLTELLFGSEFSGAVRPAGLLILGAGLLLVRQVTIANLKGIGRNDAGAASECATLLTFMVSALALAKSFSLEGVAIAVVLANFMGLCALAFFLHKVYRVHPSQLNGFSFQTARAVWQAFKAMQARDH